VPFNNPIQTWVGRRVWVVGASQGIGEAVVRALIERKAKVALSARNRPALEALARLAPVGDSMVLPLDITRIDEVSAAHRVLLTKWSGVDLVLIVAGTHQAMRAWEIKSEVTRRLVEINLLGVLNVLEVTIANLIEQGRGGVGVVSSVAGYGGLPTGLIYGATKAALINLVETLYLDLKPRGLDVYLINPGFVKTPLTDRNKFDMPALVSAEQAAERTLRGLERGEFEIHYPKRFTRLMKLLRILPYRLYFPLVHKITGL
jgi:short-subunit dehydrogenase